MPIHPTLPVETSLLPLYTAAFIVGCIFIYAILVDLNQPKTTKSDPEKRADYFETNSLLWFTTTIIMTGWFTSGLNLEELGFSYENSVTAFVIYTLTGLALAYIATDLLWTYKSPKKRQKVRTHLDKNKENLETFYFTSRESFSAFIKLSVTAGITEEIIFRGAFLYILSLWMPVWAAGLISIIAFIAMHAYQGVKGMIKLIPISSLLTIIVIFSGSIYPAIILHIMLDITAGCYVWMTRNIKIPSE